MEYRNENNRISKQHMQFNSIQIAKQRTHRHRHQQQLIEITVIASQKLNLKFNFKLKRKVSEDLLRAVGAEEEKNNGNEMK